MATLPEHQALVRRLKLLGGHARKFWQVVAQTVPKSRSTEELTFGSADVIVIIVETGPRSITVRSQGKNLKYTVQDMPPGLALAIARRALDGSEAEHSILFGACLATEQDRKPLYVEQAQSHWSDAEARGADVTDLMATLTDSYDLVR